MDFVIEKVNEAIRSYEEALDQELSPGHKSKVILAVVSKIREGLYDWTIEAIEANI